MVCSEPLEAIRLYQSVESGHKMWTKIRGGIPLIFLSLSLMALYSPNEKIKLRRLTTIVQKV